MKPLVIDSTLTQAGGMFYPTGHVFALFPDEGCVRQVAAELEALPNTGETAYARPEIILQDLVRSEGAAGGTLPTTGLEGEHLRRMGALARQGHHGLLITVSDAEADTQALANMLQAAGAKAAFHYLSFRIANLLGDAKAETVPQAAAAA